MRGTMWRQSQPQTYADWQQRRGMAPDIIREAIEEWAIHYHGVSGHMVSEVYRASLATDILEELRSAALIASADTHPKGGDAQQAPLVSGAVPRGDEADAQ